jgi:hypothetical protein
MRRNALWEDPHSSSVKVVFAVNYMARQHIAVEFLSISLVYGADN